MRRVNGVEDSGEAGLGWLQGAAAQLIRLRAALAGAPDGEVAQVTASLAELTAMCEGALTHGVAELTGRHLVSAPGALGAREWLLAHSPLTPPARAAAVEQSVRELRRATAEQPQPGSETTTVDEQGEIHGPLTHTELGGIVDDLYAGAISPTEATDALRTYDYLRRLLGKQASPACVPALQELARTHPTRKEHIDFRARMRAAAGDPDLDDEREAHHHARGMTAFRRAGDGLFESTVRLDEQSMSIVAAAIDALAAPKPTKDEHGAVIAPDERTPGQRRADALVQLANHAQSHDLRGPMGASTRLIVTIRLSDLLAGLGHCGLHVAGQDVGGPAGGLGPTSVGTSLTVAEIRRLACESDLVPAVLGSDGAPMDVGRAVRTATQSQRDYLMLRDGGCTWPGCDAPTTWCRAHHLDYWSRDHGRTDVNRMVLVCNRHHQLAHRLDATVSFRDGRPRWRVTRTRFGWATAPPEPVSAASALGDHEGRGDSGVV